MGRSLSSSDSGPLDTGHTQRAVDAVFASRGLAVRGKVVLLAYAYLCDPHGRCRPGVDRLAEMTGMSVSTVKRARADLAGRGLLHTGVGEDRVDFDRLAGFRG